MSPLISYGDRASGPAVLSMRPPGAIVPPQTVWGPTARIGAAPCWGAGIEPNQISLRHSKEVRYPPPSIVCVAWVTR